jgi:hypothetical protein
MELTFTIASATGADVFKVMEQDTADVIECANYLIKRGKKKQSGTPQPMKKKDDFWNYI